MIVVGIRILTSDQLLSISKMLIQYIKIILSIFAPVWSPALSYNSYKPGEGYHVLPTSQPNTSFQTGAHAVSQGSVTHLCAIDPLPHT